MVLPQDPSTHAPRRTPQAAPEASYGDDELKTEVRGVPRTCTAADHIGGTRSMDRGFPNIILSRNLREQDDITRGPSTVLTKNRVRYRAPLAVLLKPVDRAWRFGAGVRPCSRFYAGAHLHLHRCASAQAANDLHKTLGTEPWRMRPWRGISSCVPRRVSSRDRIRV